MAMETFVQHGVKHNWFTDYGDQAINHFGRLTEPKILTEQNAWYKSYDWRSNTDDAELLFL